ncbi:putative ribonuclease H-like domain-containing protein [Tanacetum coccineum]
MIEVFSPVAEDKIIRLFLSYVSFMGFIMYQMDVKSAFLYGTIEEEVYVCQPPGFEDPQFLDKVYKVEKALYGIHEAPRAWYETLSTYLLENGFRRGTIDKTLFIKKDKGDILLVQVMQRDDGIFISQDKYVADILKKFDFANVKTASTPLEANKALIKDEEAEDVDVQLYRSMIGSLMYLTASKPNIMFAVCACVRFQVIPKVSHLHAVKRIFRYLKGQPKLGLWYPRDSPFDLEAFSDSDYAEASLTEIHNRGCPISWQKVDFIRLCTNDALNGMEHQLMMKFKLVMLVYLTTVDGKEFTVIEASVKRHLQLADIEEPIPIVVSSSHQKTQTPRQALKEVTELPQTSEPISNVPDEAVYEEWDDRVGRATTTAASLDAAQVPRSHGGSIAQTRSEKVPTQSYDSPLPRVNTLGSDEGSMTLHELTVLCTQLSNKVESLETELKQTKQTYGDAFTKLIKKVKSTVGAAITTAGASISTASPLRVSTAEDISTAETLVYIRRSAAKDKAAVRLQEQLDEEERKRIARVHEEDISFNIEEWEDIQATIEDDEELAQRIQAEEIEKYLKAKKARLLAELINQRKIYFA